MFSSSRGFGNWEGYLSQQIDFSSSHPVKMLPMLGKEFLETSIEKWWKNEPVFVHDGETYTRQMIVLSVVNKDGGAHVDEKLEAYYEVLCAGEYALSISVNLKHEGNLPFPQGVTFYAENAHLALIRQFAHETLESIDHFKWIDI